MGRQVPLHYHRGVTCPVVNLRRWSVSAASDKKGRVFRSVGRWGNVNGDGLDGRAVSRVVKEYVAAIGLDPADFGRRRRGVPVDDVGYRSPARLIHYQALARDDPAK